MDHVAKVWENSEIIQVTSKWKMDKPNNVSEKNLFALKRKKKKKSCLNALISWKKTLQIYILGQPEAKICY